MAVDLLSKEINLLLQIIERLGLKIDHFDRL